MVDQTRLFWHGKSIFEAKKSLQTALTGIQQLIVAYLGQPDYLYNKFLHNTYDISNKRFFSIRN